MYLASTSAQVIAAIYGLTLTGFIFFRTELSRVETEDDTLIEAVETLKQRYFILLIFTTCLVTASILFANLAISLGVQDSTWINTAILNIGQSAFITSLGTIAYFIFDVIAPKRIEAASRILQSKVDPLKGDGDKGSLEEFIKNYNQIENLLADAGQFYQQTISNSYRSTYQKRASNFRLSEVLLKNDKIAQSLFQKLKELITLRNSIIHGAEPTVSKTIVEVSAQVLDELRSALQIVKSD